MLLRAPPVVLLGGEHLNPDQPVTDRLDQPEGLVFRVVSVLGWQRENQLCSTAVDARDVRVVVRR
jgi:hypothetical protein